MDGLGKGIPYHAKLESSLSDVPEKYPSVLLVVNEHWQYYFTSVSDFYSRFGIVSVPSKVKSAPTKPKSAPFFY